MSWPVCSNWNTRCTFRRESRLTFGCPLPAVRRTSGGHWLILFAAAARIARHQDSSFWAVSWAIHRAARSRTLMARVLPRVLWQGLLWGRLTLRCCCCLWRLLGFSMLGEESDTWVNCFGLPFVPFRWDLRVNLAFLVMAAVAVPWAEAEWDSREVIITLGSRYRWGDGSLISFFEREIDGFMNDAYFMKILYYEHQKISIKVKKWTIRVQIYIKTMFKFILHDNDYNHFFFACFSL